MDINTFEKTINMWGTSITQGAGSTNGFAVHNQLRELLQPYGGVRLINNYGIGGQDAEMICRHYGGIPSSLDLASTTLLSTPIVINNLSGLITDLTKKSKMFLSSAADTTTRYESGVVYSSSGGGVFPRQVAIKRTATNDGSTNTEAYTLVSLHSIDSHTLRNPIYFYPDSALNCRKHINIFELCQNVKIYNNGPYSPMPEQDFLKAISDTIFYIQSCIDKMDDPKRYLLCGMTGYGQNFGIDSAQASLRIYTDRFETAIAEAFPDNYVNQLSIPTTEELAKIDYTPTSNDLADMSNGIMPRGLMSDVIHRNNTGYKLLAYRWLNKLIEKRWY